MSLKSDKPHKESARVKHNTDMKETPSHIQDELTPLATGPQPDHPLAMFNEVGVEIPPAPLNPVITPALKKYETKTKRSQVPATTATQSRAIMFLPMYRSGGLHKLGKDQSVVVFKNEHAEVSVKGRLLTQIHRNILDAMFSYYEPARTNADGSVSYAFTLHSLMKHLGDEHARNHAWLRDRLDDMMMVVLITKTKDGWTNHSHILSNHRYSEKASNRNGDPLYVVTVDPYFLNYLRYDLHVHTEKLTPQILSLSHAPTQALVRYILSHVETNRALEDILTTIGVFRDDMTDRGRRYLQTAILEEREALERDFGIVFKKMSNGKLGVFYKQHGTVWFEQPDPVKLGLPPPPTI